MTMGNGNVYLIKKIKIIIDYTSHDSSLNILGIYNWIEDTYLNYFVRITRED